MERDVVATIGYFFERDKLSFSLFFGPGGIIEQYLHTQPSAVYLYLSSYMAYSYDAYAFCSQVDGLFFGMP